MKYSSKLYIQNTCYFVFVLRRGGKPAQIFVSQYQEAMKEQWIDKERLKDMNLDPLETELLQTTKIFYMVGKNTNLVPVIFPCDTLPSLDILASSKHRMDAGVLKDNPYLFHSTRGSEFHLSVAVTMKYVKKLYWKMGKT